jgi:hypothetical protein
MEDHFETFSCGCKAIKLPSGKYMYEEYCEQHDTEETPALFSKRPLKKFRKDSEYE